MVTFAEAATVAMVKAMQHQASEGVVIDETRRYTAKELARMTGDELRDNATTFLYARVGKTLMHLLAERDEPLAVWLRTFEAPVGYNNSNGHLRVVVETVPLKEVL